MNDVAGPYTTTVDLRVYRLSAVKKAAYRMADRCTIRLDRCESDRVRLTFDFPPRCGPAEARECTKAFFQELLDQDLREQIGEETEPLRKLILAHAFSRTGIVREDAC